MTKNLPVFGKSASFLPVRKSNWQPQTLENTGFFAKSASLPVFSLLSYEKKIKYIKEYEKKWHFGRLRDLGGFVDD